MGESPEGYYTQESGKLILNISPLTNREKVELSFNGEDNFSNSFDSFCLQDVTGYIKKLFLLKNFEKVIVDALNLNRVSVTDDSLETLEGREDYIKKALRDLSRLNEALKIDIELNLELSTEIINDIFSNDDYDPEYLAYPDHINQIK